VDWKAQDTDEAGWVGLSWSKTEIFIVSTNQGSDMSGGQCSKKEKEEPEKNKKVIAERGAEVQESRTENTWSVLRIRLRMEQWAWLQSRDCAFIGCQCPISLAQP